MTTKDALMRSGVALAAIAFGVVGALGSAQQEREEPITFEASGATPVVAAEPRSAEQLFDIYAKADQTWDAAVTRLYADDALIRHTRRYPGGKSKTAEVPVAEWKALIIQVMPTAKAKGDTNTYSNVRYDTKGERVRIRATRHSELKNYDSPIELLVGPNEEGAWRIYQEITESRP